MRELPRKNLDYHEQEKLAEGNPDVEERGCYQESKKKKKKIKKK